MGVTANQKESCIYDSKMHFKDWKRMLRLEFAKDIIKQWDTSIDSRCLPLTRHYQLPGMAPKCSLCYFNQCLPIPSCLTVRKALYPWPLSVRDGKNKHLVSFLLFWGRGDNCNLSTVKILWQFRVCFSLFIEKFCAL